MKLHQIYNPITATPFLCTPDYKEFTPCEALKPYIRCFWGSETPVVREKHTDDSTGIVTPDTCMDIIFYADFTKNEIQNSFCGIDERAYSSHNECAGKNVSFQFAIRFYAWTASMFAEESMKGTKNASFDAACHFPGIKKEVETYLFDTRNIYQLIPAVERILLHHFHEKHQNQVLLQSVAKILETKGNLSMTDLRQEVLVSSRQLERLYLEYIGVSPKSLAAMVRYQYLWNGLLYHDHFNMADAVYRYGYSDQAHLCHDFRKYHSMNISEAKKYALQHAGTM